MSRIDEQVKAHLSMKGAISINETYTLLKYNKEAKQIVANLKKNKETLAQRIANKLYDQIVSFRAGSDRIFCFGAINSLEVSISVNEECGRVKEDIDVYAYVFLQDVSDDAVSSFSMDKNILNARFKRFGFRFNPDDIYETEIE